MWDLADNENNSMFIRRRTHLVVAPSQKGGTAGLGSSVFHSDDDYDVEALIYIAFLADSE